MSNVPTIQGDRFLSLGERLRAARSPSRDWRTFGGEAALDSLPTRLHIEYGDNAEGQPVMRITLSYASADETASEVLAEKGKERISLMIGDRSGRIYAVSLLGVRLSRQSAMEFVDGILGCVRKHFDDNDITPSKLVTSLALTKLIKGVLVEQVEKIRNQLEKKGQ